MCGSIGSAGQTFMQGSGLNADLLRVMSCDLWNANHIDSDRAVDSFDVQYVGFADLSSLRASLRSSFL